jgi:hypothetical protein
MAKSSDDIPTRVVRRPSVAGLGFDDPPGGPDEQRTGVVRGQVNLDPEQVVTRRIPRPEKKGSAPSAIPVGAIDAVVAEAELPVGWITVIAGPGRGRFLPISLGMNSLGRDNTNRLPVNFGDEMISRNDHAFLIFDEEQKAFWVQHGGKSNLLRVNGNPVMAPTPLANGDVIRLGSTELRFTAFCDPAFSWSAVP